MSVVPTIQDPLGNGARGMKLIGGLSTLVVAGTLSLGCGSSQDFSSLQHDTDQPSRHTESGAWAKLSRQDYINYMMPLVGVEQTQLLDTTDDISKRAQSWLDLFDGKLRTQFPQRLAGVPKPVAQVVKTTDVNAFVGKIVSCFDGPNTSDGAEEVADAVAGFLDFGSGGIQAMNAADAQEQLGDIPCRPLASRLADARSIATLFNTSQSACQMNVTGSGTTVSKIDFAGQCISRASFTKLYLVQTADIVHFFTGIYAEFKEEQFAAVVAHELGHYYRSHGIEPNSAFEFFYKLDAVNPNQRPQREAQYDGLIPLVQMSSMIIENFSMIRKIAQQKHHSALYMAAGSFVKRLCPSGSNCPADCSEATTSVRSSTYMRELGAFPFSDVANANVQKYEDHEDRMNKCLDAIPVTSQNRTATINSLLMSVARPTWPSLLVSNPNPSVAARVAEFANFVGTWMQISMSQHPEMLQSATSAGSMFRELTAAVTKKEADSVAMYDRIFNEHLGQYTAEQEADELSVEWLSENGINASNAVETYLEFARFTSDIGSGSPFRDLDFSACKALFENGWHNQQGDYAFVAMGSLLDPHHGACYRAFNADREIVAHHSTTTGSTPAMLTEGKWAGLQTRAAQLGGTTPPTPGPGPALRAMTQLTTSKVNVRSKIGTGCTFAPNRLR